MNRRNSKIPSFRKFSSVTHENTLFFLTFPRFPKIIFLTSKSHKKRENPDDFATLPLIGKLLSYKKDYKLFHFFWFFQMELGNETIINSFYNNFQS